MPPAPSLPIWEEMRMQISDWPQCVYKKHIQDTKHAHTNQEFEHNELQNCKINHWKRFVVLNHFIFALTCRFLITHVICASICLFLIHIDSLWSPQDPSWMLPTFFTIQQQAPLQNLLDLCQPLKIHHTQSEVQTLYVQNPYNINPKPWWPKSKQNTDSQFSKQEIDPPSITMPLEICRFFAWVHHICALLLLCFPISVCRPSRRKMGNKEFLMYLKRLCPMPSIPSVMDNLWLTSSLLWTHM